MTQETYTLYSLVFSGSGSYPSPMYESFEALAEEWDIRTGSVFAYTFTIDKQFVSITKMML